VGSHAVGTVPGMTSPVRSFRPEHFADQLHAQHCDPRLPGRDVPPISSPTTCPRVAFHGALSGVSRDQHTASPHVMHTLPRLLRAAIRRDGLILLRLLSDMG
jgi:hypothetical protein